MKNKNIKFILAGVCILIGILIITISILKKDELKEKMETLKLQQNAENERIKNLDQCYNEAKKSRDNLWKINCNTQNDGSCTISSQNTIKWIEQRYEQDIDNCNSEYGN